MRKICVESRNKWVAPELKKVAIEEITAKSTRSTDGVGHADS